MMRKSYAEYRERWVKENYANVRVRIPKSRKVDLDLHCRQSNESINGLVNRLLRTEIGMTKEEWESKSGKEV